MNLCRYITRESALISARRALLLIANEHDDQHAAEHAAVIQDLLEEHRKRIPLELAKALS